MKIEILKKINWFEEGLTPLFAKMPNLSLKVRRDIVTSLPFVIIFIGCVSMLQAIMGLVYKVTRLLFSTPELLTFDMISSVITNALVGFVLISSFGLLRKNKVVGWQYVFGVTLFTGILNLLYNPLSLLQSGIFLYILFQTRKEYHP